MSGATSGPPTATGRQCSPARGKPAPLRALPKGFAALALTPRTAVSINLQKRHHRRRRFHVRPQALGREQPDLRTTCAWILWLLLAGGFWLLGSAASAGHPMAAFACRCVAVVSYAVSLWRIVLLLLVGLSASAEPSPHPEPLESPAGEGLPSSQNPS